MSSCPRDQDRQAPPPRALRFLRDPKLLESPSMAQVLMIMLWDYHRSFLNTGYGLKNTFLNKVAATESRTTIMNTLSSAEFLKSL